MEVHYWNYATDRQWINFYQKEFEYEEIMTKQKNVKLILYNNPVIAPILAGNIQFSFYRVLWSVTEKQSQNNETCSTY